MDRLIERKLLEWKDSPDRKPLVVLGMRQCGKTYTLRRFGEEHYSSTVYLDFESMPELRDVFWNLDPMRIIETLSKRFGPITPDTLMIFDEVQMCYPALTSLKYFCQDAPEYHIVCAGSLLGVSLADRKGADSGFSFPVGKVDFLRMRPMCFGEFVMARLGRETFEFMDSLGPEQPLPDGLMRTLEAAYREYLLVGGMPECVASWAQNRDFDELDRIQDALMELYEYDVTKYHGRINPDKILLVFRRLVSQLAKPNEKFIYGALRKGARATEYEGAIEWLCSAGLVNRVYNVTRPEFPLKAYEDISAFKLFFSDTGLLKHMAQLDNSPILTKTSYQFKGPLSENFVLQQLTGQFPATIAYYSTKNMEIDFLLQAGSRLIPMEVKGEEDRRAPSFKRYLSEHEPDMAIRFSKMGYQDAGSFTNMPLYLASRLKDLI